MVSRSTACKATVVLAILAVAGVGLSALPKLNDYRSGLDWPRPKVIDPGPVGGPPSDAIVLFDGKNLSQWSGGEHWIVEKGYAVANKASIHTKQAFGDCQLHLEWAEPEKVVGSSQGRGNSGVIFMGRYEVQVLDSYNNETYYDGQCASIYKQHPPLVNASRKPGEWQTYDIIFKAPRFDPKGKLQRPATVTVLQNGVLVQDHFELLGDTPFHRAPRYDAHSAKLPLELQYHFNPVRFRNIWIRELPEEQPPKRIAPPGMLEATPAGSGAKVSAPLAPVAEPPTRHRGNH
jgi:hypothetical protein